LDIRSSIADTRKGFEESFASGDFYNRQTQDEKHLQRIPDLINISEGMNILDLGCGSGYLSFPIAENNLSFVSYDGIDFPFETEAFDLVVTRYALHHFPDIEHSIGEVNNILFHRVKIMVRAGSRDISEMTA
jgi:ubiquinone/menaquinone biosynthesis C-methylase UbiE